jgi:hypothetical protein
MNRRLCANQSHEFTQDPNEIRGYRCVHCPLVVTTEQFRSVPHMGLPPFMLHLNTHLMRLAEREWAIRELES